MMTVVFKKLRGTVSV